MIIYLIQTSVSLLILLGLYLAVLENLKMHQFKRFYLLSAIVISLVFPLIKITNSNLPWKAPISNTNLEPLAVGISTSSSWNIITLVYILYGIGVLIFLSKFIYNLVQINQLKKDERIQTINGISYVFSSKTSNTFAFWNCIYLPTTQFNAINETNEIILHEIAHIKQRHTVDVLFVELLKIIFWFNPIFYFYKKVMILNHEFLADESVINKTKNTVNYLKILMQQQLQTNTQNLSSSFYNQPIKKRFIMTTKTINKRKNLIVKGFSTLLIAGIAITSMGAKDKQDIFTPKLEQSKIPQLPQPEKTASFPGGMNEFNKYFISKFKTPSYLTSTSKPLQIIVQFIVQKDGSLSEFKLLRGIDDQTNQHVIDILEKSPLWIPAEKDGEKATSMFTIPITIKLDPEPVKPS